MKEVFEELVQFAKKHHKGFGPFSDETIRTFFVKYKETTKVRFDETGKITGFAVWTELPDKIIFIAIAGVGDRKENYREMMKHLRRFKKTVCIYSEKGKKWVIQ